MQRAAALAFVFIFLMANTAFGQLLRLPVLVHHYIEHVELDNTVSMMDFLAEHYVEKINHPDDSNHNHQKLPFKSVDCHSNSLSLLNAGFFYSVFRDSRDDDSEIIFVCHSNYSSSYLDSIWQPPRI